MGDSLLRLVLSVEANPGVYAILLGSGVSRAAGIPTGWEIVTDLVGKLARAAGEKMEPDAENWYRARYGQEPRYSDILERICPTPAERQALLRSYFEPTDEEREQGLRVPTVAHKAIASLVKDGFVKMILTTNFDRLVEEALEEQSITPDVISSDDMIKGAIPYVHSQCTILKLHGDYRDTRIKNTPEELSSYSELLNGYLDRILDEFGLVVCGWSGEWDVALKEAIVRCPTRRFTTYWCTISEPREDAKRIIQNRHAEVIQIRDANSVFSEISEKVFALRDMTMPSPMSGPMATALTKRFLSEEKYRIRLHDLVSNELENLHAERSSSNFKVEYPGTPDQLKSEFQRQMKSYESVSDTLLSILGTISYFDKGSYSAQIKTSLDRLLEVPIQGGRTILLALRRYPAVLTAYVVGINALAAGNYGNLAAALLKPKAVEGNTTVPGIFALYAGAVFGDATEWLPMPGAERMHTPASAYVQMIVREKLKGTIPSDVVFQSHFDIFEYIVTLAYADQIPTDAPRFWAPTGCFSWRYPKLVDEKASNPINDFFAEGRLMGNDWGLLASGFFGGSAARLDVARKRYGDLLKVLVPRWW